MGVLLQPTSPLRSSADIEGVLDKAKNSTWDAVISVCQAKHHPTLIYQIEGEGSLKPFIESKKNTRRQDFSKALAINGACYMNKTDIFRKYQSFIPPNTTCFEMPANRSVDIDNPEDWELAEYYFDKLATESLSSL